MSYHIQNYNAYNDYPASIDGCQILSHTYYDDYSQDDLQNYPFDPNQFTGITPPNTTVVAPPSVNSTMTRGLVTGSKVRVMDPADPNADNWLLSVNYYDDKGRVIQTQSQNLHSGTDISSNVYYFQGELYKNILRHQNQDAQAIPYVTEGAITEYRLENTFVRNFAINGGNDQVWKHTQKINSGIDYQLAYYDYDHLGRNTAKQFSSVLNLNAYNMRGFLNETAYKSFNQDTFFNENLFYDKGFGSKLYNGNIAGITWTGNDQQQKAYGYSYDSLNRLTYAQFKQNEGSLASPSWSSTNHDYTASNITYDPNGNIQSMNQQVTTTGSPFTMDQLVYNYAPNSNQLTRVNDAIPTATTAAYSLPDFKDGTTANNAVTAVEYNYDPNGNMTSDANKGISSITYNYLNKPEIITVDGKGTITYVYDATGNRLQKRVVPVSGTPENWDYIGNFVYKDNTLQYILNDEGRARPIAADPTGPNSDPSGGRPTKFIYDYFTKDHLGNVRSTVTSQPMSYPYLARHEVVTANTEELVFDNIPNVRDIKPGSIDPHDGFAARLNAEDASKTIGTAIMLQTNPGDRFQIGADAFYDESYFNYDNISATDLVSSLANTLMGGHTYDGVPLSELPNNLKTVRTVLSNPALTDQLANLYQNSDDPDGPKAHLTYLWFNDKMELDMHYSGSLQLQQNQTGWQPMGPVVVGGIQGGSSPIVGTVVGGSGGFPSTGFILVYIDNQMIGKDVWFDNVLVDNYTSVVSDEEHYYPFGLTLDISTPPAGIASQPYKLTTKELEKNFDLNLYDFGARYFDMTIGRWNGIDELADKYYNLSPYNYCGDDPTIFVDKDGKKIRNADKIRKEKGEETVSNINKLLNAAKEKYGNIDDKKKFNGTDAQWKSVERTKQALTKAEETVKTYTYRAQATEEEMKEWNDRSPNLYAKLDNEPVDIMFGVQNVYDPETDLYGKGAFTIIPSINEDGTISTEEFGKNTLLMYVDDSPQDREAFHLQSGQYMDNHEAGHAEYWIHNPIAYRNYLNELRDSNRKINGGHNSDDKSGKKANEYGKQRDIEKP